MLELRELLELAADSAREVACGPLGSSAVSWEAWLASPLSADLCGVYIPLVGEAFALQLGVLAERAVCTQLAKSLLGMTADEPLESDEDVFDAVGEITNLVAGGLKARLSATANVTLGLPLAIRGKIFPSVGSQSSQGLMRVDGNEVWLVLTGTKPR